MRWAVVTGTSPLRVQLDGDSTALPYAPKCLAGVEALTAGDMVVTDRIDGTVVILGRPGGGVPFASVAETQAFASSTKAVTPAGLAGVLRPVIGQIPSVQVTSGSYTIASDGTVTLTNVGAFSLNNVFDGLGGDSYRLIGWLTASGETGNLYMRLRTSGADQTGNVYSFVNGSWVSTSWGTPSPGTNAYGSQTTWLIGYRQVNNLDYTIKQPAVTGTSNRELLGNSMSDGSNQVLSQIGARTSAIAPSDGFTILPFNAVTLSGWVKVVKEA